MFGIKETTTDIRFYQIQNKMNAPSDYDRRASFGIQAKLQFQKEYSTLFGMNPDICDGILQTHGLLNQYLVICVMNHVLFRLIVDLVLLLVQ